MNRLIKLLVFTLVSFVWASPNVGQPNANLARKDGIVLNHVPQKVDTSAHYLFYLHGYIVEAGNTRPTSPRFGVYEYEQILETFKQNGFVVISEARKKDPEVEPYAARVTEQVRQLLQAGVPPKHITIVGASQGSWIAMLASTYLENRNLNFVLIAACSADEGFSKVVKLHGNVLSIYEKSDLAQSCQIYRKAAKGINEWKEVPVNTGLKHGFLYRPIKEWIEPTIAWAKREVLYLLHATDGRENKRLKPSVRPSSASICYKSAES